MRLHRLFVAQDSAADLKDDVEGLKQMMPLDIDEFATEIAALVSRQFSAI